MTTEPKREGYKRKQYIVAPGFQFRYVGLILLLMFLTAALCSYVVYYTSMINLGEKLANVYPQGRLVSIVKIVNFRILVSVLLISPLVAVIGIFLSHRIAGPIYRMEKFLADLAGGNLGSRLTLREKDELTPLANGINFVIDNLREAVTKEKAHAKAIVENAALLKAALDSKESDPSRAKEVAGKIVREVDGLSKDLEKYRL